ncbi:hypothetical protein MNAN1_001585 [Malassezia nana]|uniref:Uncharacterized protein n=1 Tax=Malassezia nana TaxID=180528 RepID=A0AAF0J233_9BASI|nr:hypothetical protein MNAN1_001585 [Malassezia nana]
MAKRVRRQSKPCRSKDLYQAPAAGQAVSSNVLTLRWNPDCIQSSTIDVYLYSQHQSMSLPVHAWLGLSTAAGSKNVPLQSQWWNHTQNMTVNLQMVPGQSQPWESPYPLSYSWTLGQADDGDVNIDASVASSNKDVTRYEAPDSLSPDKLAAACILPILALLAVLFGGYLWQRKRQAKRDAERQSRYTQQTSPTLYTHTSNASQPEPTWTSMPVSYVDVPAMQPVEHDATGMDSVPSSLHAEETKEIIEAPPPPPASTKRHRARHKKTKRSTASLSKHNGTTYGLEDMSVGDLVPASREQAEEQRWTHAFLPSSRLTLLEQDVDSDTAASPRESAMAPTRREHYTDNTRRYAANRPAPPIVDVDAEWERDPYMLDHHQEEDHRPMSPMALGVHSRDEKIHAYLSQLPHPNDLEPLEDSDAHPDQERPHSSASRLSQNSDAFHDAVAHVA